VDRKTVKRYVRAGIEAALVRNGDEAQLTDELSGQVCERVRPHRPDGHGAGWEVLRAHPRRPRAVRPDSHFLMASTESASFSVANVHERFPRTRLSRGYARCPAIQTCRRFQPSSRFRAWTRTGRGVPLISPPFAPFTPAVWRHGDGGGHRRRVVGSMSGMIKELPAAADPLVRRARTPS
jgi:hypothetical protein